MELAEGKLCLWTTVLTCRKLGTKLTKEEFLRVCLSHFSELETGDKQAFDTHNQTPIQTRIQTRFSDVVFIGPFLVHLVGDITRLSSYFSAQLQCAV